MDSDDAVRFADATVRLMTLNQSRTYAGLLEGVPTRKRNAGHIARLREAYPGAYIVPPEEEPIELSQPYPFGEPASLPGLECITTFEGRGLTDPILWRSHLTVIWFQKTWCMPIDPGVLAHLRRTAWQAHASEYEI